jgi:hypothetical protein
MSGATPGDDLSLDDLACVVDDLARRYAKALATAIEATSDRADERAHALARGDLPGVRRILAEIISDIEAVERRVDAIGDDRRAAIVEAGRRLQRFSDAVEAIQAIRAADLDDGRMVAILGDPLAQHFPVLALTLCGAGTAAKVALEAMQIAAINGGVPPSADPGGGRLQ